MRIEIELIGKVRDRKDVAWINFYEALYSNAIVRRARDMRDDKEVFVSWQGGVESGTNWKVNIWQSA